MAGDSDAATEDNSDAAAAVPPDSVASFGDDCDNEAPLEYVVVFMPPLTCGMSYYRPSGLGKIHLKCI